jgi:pimeloyl-ACP methyl ester carboxylesterase
MFFHFCGGSSNTFSSVANALSPDIPTVALDFRGWGASTGPNKAEAYSTADLSTDAKKAIQELQLNSVVLVGHSMGGKVAVSIAGQHILPAGVLKGLALLAPAPPTPLSLPDPSMREQQLHAFDNIENAEVVIRDVLTAPNNPWI